MRIGAGLPDHPPPVPDVQRFRLARQRMVRRATKQHPARYKYPIIAGSCRARPPTRPTHHIHLTGKQNRAAARHYLSSISVMQRRHFVAITRDTQSVATGATADLQAANQPPCLKRAISLP